MIGKTIGHYKILEELGHGGMGVVYRAEDTKLERCVAIKVLPPHLTADEHAKERFIREARAASALEHPGICHIHEIGETPETGLFIVMPCYEGETLGKRLEGGPLEVSEALEIAAQLASALASAHHKGIVHRDIKPRNVMLTETGQAKLMDFGLAKRLDAAKTTQTGVALGTVSYMSPEQARGEAVDHRTDIWSLGVVLYEMLAGRLPFKGDYEPAILYSILSETPEPVAGLRSDIPSGLEDILAKALEKEPDKRYQQAEDLLTDIKRLREGLPSGVLSGRQFHKRRKMILVAGAAALVIVLALVIGFRIRVGVQPSALAGQNSLAVMYFENLVDPQDPKRLGEIATNLLITDLSESHYVKVVSSQRLYDILKLLGKEGQKRIDRDVATRVAKEAGVKWMLLGNILRTDPHIEIATQLVDVATGKVEASQRVTGAPAEEIFSLVDKLTVEIKNDLSLPAGARSEPDLSVAEVTTSSSEAYRHYLEGVDYAYKTYWVEAEESFEKALERDSTFAMAYYWLASAERQRGKGERREVIAKALKYSHKASEKERHYIKSLNAVSAMDFKLAIAELEEIVERYPEEKDALFHLGILHKEIYGDLEKAAGYLERVIKVDPLYKYAYNELAYLYDMMGDFEKSIWAINEYISLVPDEANPYDTRAEIYANNGKLDQAIESYKKALELKPDFYPSLESLGYMYVFKTDYAGADRCFRELCTSDDKATRALGRTCLALIPVYQGKLDEGLKVVDDGLTADRLERAEGVMRAAKHVLKAGIYEEKENYQSALAEAEACMEVFSKTYPDHPLGMRWIYAHYLAKSGRVTAAEEVVETVRNAIEGTGVVFLDSYWGMKGDVEQIKGNVQAAAECLEKARDASRTDPQFTIRVMLAKAYLDLDRHGDAVTELEKALSRYDRRRARSPFTSVKAHYYLALAYEKSGWKNRAISEYERLLGIWKNADPRIAELDDARERLARLKSPA